MHGRFSRGSVVDAARALRGHARTGALRIKCERRRCSDLIFTWILSGVSCRSFYAIWKHPHEPAHWAWSSPHAAQCTAHSILQRGCATMCAGWCMRRQRACKSAFAAWGRGPPWQQRGQAAPQRAGFGMVGVTTPWRVCHAIFPYSNSTFVVEFRRPKNRP